VPEELLSQFPLAEEAMAANITGWKDRSFPTTGYVSLGLATRQS